MMYSLKALGAVVATICVRKEGSFRNSSSAQFRSSAPFFSSVLLLRSLVLFRSLGFSFPSTLFWVDFITRDVRATVSLLFCALTSPAAVSPATSFSLGLLEPRSSCFSSFLFCPPFALFCPLAPFLALLFGLERISAMLERSS
jgi:hypothetical protein